MMTFAFKILLCFFILQSRYKNGESSCCSIRLFKWNCGCNVFGCNCNYNPDDDYCYYKDVGKHPYYPCEKSDEIASSFKRTEILPEHPDRNQAFKKSIERH